MKFIHRIAGLPLRVDTAADRAAFVVRSAPRRIYLLRRRGTSRSARRRSAIRSADWKLQFGVKLFMSAARLGGCDLNRGWERYLAKVSARLGDACQERVREMLLQSPGTATSILESVRFRFSPARSEARAGEFQACASPATTLAHEATHQYARLQQARSECRHSIWPRAFDLGNSTRGRGKFPLCSGLPPHYQRRPLNQEDLSRQVMIHLTSHPRAWPACLNASGLELNPRGLFCSTASRRCWRSAEQGLGFTAGHGCADQGRDRNLVKKRWLPFDVEARHPETIICVFVLNRRVDRRIARCGD